MNGTADRIRKMVAEHLVVDAEKVTADARFVDLGADSLAVELEHSPDDIQVLIDYARQRFSQERSPLSPSLRPVREALNRVFPPPKPSLFPLAKFLRARTW